MQETRLPENLSLSAGAGWRVYVVSCSQVTEVFDALHLNAVGAHRLVHVVGVGGVASGAILRGAHLSFVTDLFADWDVLLHHLDSVDVIDLDVMSGEAVVQEVGREHHAVASEPEFGLVLSVEGEHVSRADESESAEDHVSGNAPGKEAGVVEGSVLETNVTREDTSLGTNHLVDGHPPVVDETEHAEHAMLSVLSLAHFEVSEEGTDGTATLGESLVHKVLHTSSLAKHPGLESLGHFIVVNYNQL